MTATRIALLLGLLFPLPAFAGGPEIVDVFVPKADGFKSIRIPAVVVSKRRLVLLIQARPDLALPEKLS